MEYIESGGRDSNPQPLLLGMFVSFYRWVRVDSLILPLKHSSIFGFDDSTTLVDDEKFALQI